MQRPQGLLHRTPLAEQREQLPPFIFDFPIFHRVVILGRFVVPTCKTHRSSRAIRENGGRDSEKAVEGGRRENITMRMWFRSADRSDGMRGGRERQSLRDQLLELSLRSVISWR